MHEVIVVGGGPAGLQAALTLARVHRDVVLVDAGEGRNAPASHMHNLVSRDGTPPEEFRSIAQTQLAAYPTAQVRQARVVRVAALPPEDRPEPSVGEEEVPRTAYQVEVEDGSQLTASSLILATGIRDELPDIPGLAELWGGLVVHCPFCHGHELAGKRIGILGAGAAPHLSGIMRRVASELVVLTEGEELDDSLDLPVRQEAVREVRRDGEQLQVLFESGEPLLLGGLFVSSTARQAAPFAEQLGLECNPSGGVIVDEHARTSLRGVFAAGDMAHLPSLPAPVQSVPHAIATGAIAGGSAVADPVEDA